MLQGMFQRSKENVFSLLLDDIIFSFWVTFDTHFLFLNIVYFLVKIFFLGKELDELTFEDDGENLKVNAERLHRMASIEGHLDDESESKSVTNLVHIVIGPGRGTWNRTNHEIIKTSRNSTSHQVWGRKVDLFKKVQRPKWPHWQDLSISKVVGQSSLKNLLESRDRQTNPVLSLGLI